MQGANNDAIDGRSVPRVAAAEAVVTIMLSSGGRCQWRPTYCKVGILPCTIYQEAIWLQHGTATNSQEEQKASSQDAHSRWQAEAGTVKRIKMALQ